MKNLAHSASFESLDKDAPANCETKHLSNASATIHALTLAKNNVKNRKNGSLDFATRDCSFLTTTASVLLPTRRSFG
jgi:hypothetical protein